MLEDYHSRPGYRSELVCTPEELGNLVMHYHAAGIQIAVHTNGDAAIEATRKPMSGRSVPCPALICITFLFMRRWPRTDSSAA